MARDMPKPCEFPSLDELFLWAHKEVDLAAHPVIGLVFQGADAETCPQALGLKSLDLFLKTLQLYCFLCVKNDHHLLLLCTTMPKMGHLYIIIV